MNVTVRVFAAYADALGADQVSVQVPEPATVGSLRLAVSALSAVLPPRPLIAVNEEYATDEVPLRANDSIAIIPPVAGG